MTTVKRNLVDSLRLGDRGWRNALGLRAEDAVLLGDKSWQRATMLVANDALILDNRINGRQSTTWLK